MQLDSLQKVTAVVEAKGFSLMPYLFTDEINIDIDAKSDVEKTNDTFIFNVAKNRYLFEAKLGESYVIRSLKPEILSISYSKLESKMVPLNLVSNIEYGPGFDLFGEFVLSTDSITVVGSKESISLIKELQTQPLNLENINADIKATLTVDASEYEGVEVFPKQISVAGKTARFTEGTIEIPVIITEKPEQAQINVFPKSVSVSYYVALSEYNNISPSDFIVECEFPEDLSKVSYLVPKLTKKPEIVKRATIKQKRIDFIIL